MRERVTYCRYDCMIAGETSCTCVGCDGRLHGSWRGIALRLKEEDRAVNRLRCPPCRECGGTEATVDEEFATVCARCRALVEV